MTDATTITSTLLCSTAAFFGRPLRYAMEAIAGAGFRGIEVMVTRDPPTQDANALIDLSGEHGLEIRALHAPFLLMTRGVFGTDPLQKIFRTVELAEEVGANLVVVHPPYRWQGRYRTWLADQLPAFSASAGIHVAVENMFPIRLPRERRIVFHTGQGIADWERHERVVLDTSHAAVAGLDLVETAERLGSRLAHVHLSNNNGRGWDSHLPVDHEDGVLPLGDLLDSLVRRRWSGTVSLELDIREQLEDPQAVRALLERQRLVCERRLSAAAEPSGTVAAS